MDFVFSIASKVAGLLVAPIGRQIAYVFNYDDNIGNLKNHVEKLMLAKERIQHSADEARRQGEEIEADVVKWLSTVNAAFDEVDKFFVDEDKANDKSCMGFCPNMKTRHQLSRKATEKSLVVVELQGEADKFDRVSYRAAPLGTGVIPLESYEAFDSRTLVLNQIVEALKDASVNRIGVYGMGGVGKTTLVKKIAEQVKADRIFDMVVLAVVSRTPDLRRIQGEIAYGLGFNLDEETEGGRANGLHERLKKEKKILVVLDDIWGRLDLEDVGIPSGSDHEGCKILMTSRNQNILSREMGANDNFLLRVLSKNEAWNLFEKMAGYVVKDPKLQFVACQVAERCAGLPILLVTTARALKNGDF